MEGQQVRGRPRQRQLPDARHDHRPATTAVIAGVATGIGGTDPTAADVTLKERRPLVLVPRETPVRASTLRQMANLAAEGAR